MTDERITAVRLIDLLAGGEDIADRVRDLEFTPGEAVLILSAALGFTLSMIVDGVSERKLYITDHVVRTIAINADKELDEIATLLDESFTTPKPQ